MSWKDFELCCRLARLHGAVRMAFDPAQDRLILQLPPVATELVSLEVGFL